MKNFFDKLKSYPLASGIIGSIVCGALWERIFSPITNVVFDKMLSLGGKLTVNISKYTYRQISNGFSESSSDFILIIFMVMFIGALFSLSLELRKPYLSLNSLRPVRNSEALNHNELISMSEKTKQLTKDINNAIQEYKIIYKKAYIFLNLLFFLVAFLLIFTITQITYVNTTITKLTNNIEIVSPYITDLQYKKLKSTFHSMSSRPDYDALVLSLDAIAKKNNIYLK